MKKAIEILKKNRKLLTNLLTVLVLVLMGIYLYRNREVFSLLKNLRIDYLLYIVIARVIVVFINAFVNKEVIEILGKKIKFKESLLLQYSNNFLNKIMSQGGSVFRGVVLKKHYNLPYTKFVSTIAGLYIINFLSYSIIGLISLIYIFIVYQKSNYLISFFFLVLLIFTGILIIWNPRLRNKKKNRIIRLINSVLEGWNKIKREREKIIIFLIAAILSLGLSAFKTIVVFKTLGENLGIFQSLYMSCITIMTTFINITPDGIGMKEGIFMFSSEIIGLEPDVILLGSLMTRGIYLMQSLILGGISYFILMRNLNQKVQKKRGNTKHIEEESPIYIILGTRAQFIKMAPVMCEMKRRAIDYSLIYTVQHKENIQEILDTYDLRKPDVVIYKGEESNTFARGMRWAIDMFLKSIFKAKVFMPKKGIVLTHGDTFTAWLGALMGRMAGCKVAHVESGLRSFNILRPFPEEISRLITFTLSNIYFCADDWAISNLKGFKGEKIDIGANTMLDGVKYAIGSGKESKFNFQENKYALVSIHRYENIFKSRFTEEILPYLKKISEKIKLVITLHPTTRERLKELNLYDSLDKNPRIILHDRFDFIDWINVCNKAEFVISDGGSNQEELSYLGIPTILFREETERKEGLGENIILSKFDKRVIMDFVDNYKKYRRKPLFEKISPSKRIVDYLS